MPPKRVPIKGEPDFTTISDERLKGFIDLAQQMIFAYKHEDAEKTRVLKEIWKDCTNEYTDRLSAACQEALMKEESSPIVSRRIKTVKLKKR